MIDSAINKVEICSVDSVQAREALYQLQLSTESPFGTIVYLTGGLLIENGWIRVFGSGSNKLPTAAHIFNKGKTFYEPGENMPYMLIASDALGGFFCTQSWCSW
jgi:hypothetical protein